MSGYAEIETAYKNGYEAGKKAVVFELRHAVNELCANCGRYREEHLGACDGCWWQSIKKTYLSS